MLQKKPGAQLSVVMEHTSEGEGGLGQTRLVARCVLGIGALLFPH